MGKYVKKGKITGDVSVMEVSQSALGVRTRAKTLALQQTPDFRYLQLRSRRLEKPLFPPPPSPARKPENEEKTKEVSKLSNRSGSGLHVESVNRVSSGRDSLRGTKKGEAEVEFKTEIDSLGLEVSFADNNLELNGTGRSTRESTPCSLIRNVGSIGTPGSTVRSMYSGSANQGRVQDLCVQRSVPSAREMEDFFANAGRQQQQQFIDKYNFDFLNDLPLPGRYEWVRVSP